MHYAFAVVVVGTLTCATVLVINGHPWFAAFLILIASGVSMKESGK